MASTGASSLTPALFTRISIVPSALSASANKRRAAAMSLRSHRQEKERRPRARTAVSTSDAPSTSSLWQKATSAPSAAKARASAAPIPRLPPVTSAVRFSSLPAIGLLSIPSAYDNRYRRSGDGERLVQRGVEMTAIIWVPEAHMAPDRGHLVANPVGDEAGLVMTVDRRKIAVRLAGQNDGLRRDAAERLREVAAIGGCLANVSIHPGPDQSQQVVGVMMNESGLPEILHELLGAFRAESAIALRSIERFREAPSGVDRRKGPETGDGRRLIEPLSEGRIVLDRAPERNKEDLVERRGARRTAHRHDRIHHGWILGRPLERLAATHRPPRHQFEMFDLERLQQHVLQAHVVMEGYSGKPAGSVRGTCVVRGSRDAAANQVGDDDKIFVGIERPIPPGQRRFAHCMVAAEPSWQQHDVIPLGRQCPQGAIGQRYFWE